jgi:streptogramin lyase
MKIVKQKSRVMLSEQRLAVCALSLAAIGLAGCSNGLSSASSTGTSPVQLVQGRVTGNVHGGQNPVSAATIQLYAVGSTGLQSAATALITSSSVVGGTGTYPVVTNSSGDFNITGDYTCPTPSPQVYLVATGGNSGGGTNSAIALMAPLGDCATLKLNTATTFVQINELTTVASAYALAPFMSGFANVGAATVNAPGLINAVANFNNLVNLSTGVAGGASLPAGATVPVAEINTLGDVLAACVNTSSSTSTNCNTLFGPTAATDTIGAALAIAKNPGASSLTVLYTLASPTAPFQPTLSLSAPPNDWTIAIKYTATGTLNTPYGIAIDAAGNAWITNLGGSAVTKLTSAGTLVSNYSATGLIGAKGIAIDRSGNVWVANTPMNSVIEFNSSGVADTPYTVGGLNGPVSIAMDSGGNAWVANLVGNSVTEIGPAGTAVKTSLSAGSTISGPSGIALDSSGNVYVANSGNGNVVKLTNSTGAAAVGSPLTDVALQGTTAVAVDGSGNGWATGSTTGSAIAGAVSQFSSSGTPASDSPLTNGGLALPVGVAISGTNAWVTNGGTSGSLSQLQLSQTAPLSPAAGLGSLSSPAGVAIDPSGDIWTANSGDNTVSVFIGLTSPVTTPLAANVGP